MASTRILYLIKSLGRGGAERLLVDLATGLDRARFSPQVAYAFDEPNDLLGELAAAAVPTTRIGDGRGRWSWLRDLRERLRREPCDVLHAHSPYIAAGARLLPRPPGLLRLYTEHNEWPAYHPATRWANALTYRREDRVLAVSEQVRRSARLAGPLGPVLPRPPLETLHHGVDVGRLRASAAEPGEARAALGLAPDALVVGTVANFRPQKAHDVLVEAAARVREELPDVRFVLVGGGPTEAAVRRRAASLGLDDNVIFAGYRDDAARVVPAFDVFALPSRHEGLPIALVEAMALGVPAVATDVGGVSEAFGQGMREPLVPPEDPASLATALLELLRSPAKRIGAAGAAARRAEELDIRHAVARLEAIYSAARPL